MSWVGRIVADKYRLMQVVGTGGQGLVYRGMKRGTDTEVAVKVLHKDLPNLADLEVRLTREHEALEALKETAATKAYGLFREDGALCLVLEYLRGQDLDHYLADIEDQGRRMDTETLVEYLTPIVDTLDVAHGKGIIHRDLKPANIYVLGRGGPGGVRLLDFGLAWTKHSKRITARDTVLGSPSYIAPEVWNGDTRELDHRVDVYSLGVIIYRALTGMLPIGGTTLREKLHAAKHAPRPSLTQFRPDLPKATDAWVQQALAINRADRFLGVRALWNALLSSFQDIRSGGRSWRPRKR